ncbi:MAG: hypothetical protein FJ264_01255 [Planctomycetes bacterium]|nr:hypothetical protein [Planctomycetota bacterium]
MKKLSILVVVIVLCPGIFLIDGKSFAKNKEQPYELSVNILQDADNIAEVSLDIMVMNDSYSAPTTAKQIKLKSSSGKKIFKNVSLTPKTDGSGSFVVLQYDNKKNAKSINVSVKIEENEEGIKLNVKSKVRLLPDVTVEDIGVRCSIAENQETKITAKIIELNGDTEASADISLFVEDTVVGSSTVTVKPGEITDVVFNTSFDTTGAYDVTVRVDNVQPEDYDQTNNSSSSTALVSKTPDEALALSENLNYVFDIDSLPVITITISTDEWNNQLLYYDSNPMHEEYSTADFTFEKNSEIENIEGIGFRIRGNMYSRKRLEGEEGYLHDPESPQWRKAHLKIDFTEYNKDVRFRGLRGLNLKYFKDDDAYVREVYCYDLFKKFGVWTAPFSSYVRVYIKIKEDDTPAYYGVYCMVENIDKEFLQERFGKDNDEGYLWKCLYPADLTYINLDTYRIGVEDVSLNEEESYRPAYDLKTNKSDLDTAKEQLIRFIEDLNEKGSDEFADWIQSTMDVDLFIKTLAVHVLLGSWDDYWININNYYLYFDECGMVYLIPYDYDLTLGISDLLVNTGTQDVMKWGAMNNSKPFVYKMLSVQQFRDIYKSYLRELIDENNDYFDYEHSIARINTWHALIENYIENDTGRMMEIKDQPPDWSNATFYRLLSGDDSGAEPEANWFKTRSTFALEHIAADEGWTSGVAQITAELYLMGSMNDWESEAEYRFTNNEGLYTLEISLSENEYTFRISDDLQNELTNFGAPDYAKNLNTGEKMYLYSEYSDPILADIEWTLGKAGKYRFEFDATDSENPTLLVTRIK